MNGLHVLVVEEEYLIAADMELTLEAAGVARVTTVRVPEAVSDCDLSIFDVAVIEARFGSESAIELCAALREAGVAVVVTSADHAVQTLFTGAIPLQKPFDSDALLSACDAAWRRNPSVSEPV